MEDDDEFGDLYTDVLRPLQPQPQQIDSRPSSLGRPIDSKVDSDDEEMLYGASESKTSVVGLNPELNSEKRTFPHGAVDRGGSNLQDFGGFKKRGEEKLLDKRSGVSNFLGDDDPEISVEGQNGDDILIENKSTFMFGEEGKSSIVERIGASGNWMDQGVARNFGAEQVIPGLSRKLENHGDSNFEDDLESDESEDDLEIVLNDNGDGLAGIERMKGLNGEDDDEGGPLVIVAGDGDFVHQQMINEQEWKGEDGGAGVDAEKKVLGYAARSDGGGAAVPALVAPKIGFNNHMYHHPLHSQFKYVRPGATPIPGTAPVISGGVPGLARPPIIAPLVAGRGRGDWRPTGIRGASPMQKGFLPNYGAPVMGSIAGRGYGSGLDFTLPSHRTIFEVDIDGFEEKPWKYPGIDVTDFFNFGLNAESWKDYCKQLEQLRLETTMQSKIRVYESSRAEQDYDPDLPPELAAAVGNNNIHSENANTGKVETSSDLARASSRGWPPTLIGRPIPVETGSADRVPSTDTRRLRLHDSDTIIEIICQRNPDDDDDEMANQENNPAGESHGLIDGTDELQNNDSEHTDHSLYPSNATKINVPSRRTTNHKKSASPSAVDGGDLHSDSEVSLPRQPKRETGTKISQRPSKERAPVKAMSIGDHHNESSDGDNGKKNPLVPSSEAIYSEAEPYAAVEDKYNDQSAVDDRGQETEGEERAKDPTTSDDKSMRKKRGRSQVDQVYKENDKDLKSTMSAENSKARSGSSKDNRQFGDNFEDEVVQDRHGIHARSQRRQVASEYNAPTRSHREKEVSGRHHVMVKSREESISRRRGDPSISLHRQVKGENIDSRKETDVSEGSWRRRDEDHHMRRAGVEDTRKRVHGDEISSKSRSMVKDREKLEKDDNYHSRNQLEKGAWRGADYDQDNASRQRHWEDNLKVNSEEVNDFNDKRRKDGAYAIREQGDKEGAVFDYKDSGSHWKRERNDTPDHWKRDDLAKSRNDDLHHVKKKEERSMQKERDERPKGYTERNRSKESHEENFSRKERDAAHSDMRSGRPTEDKSWDSRSRGKDNYKGSGRDDIQKDVGRNGDPVRRRDRSESEKVSQQRVNEDVQTRAGQSGKGEKRTRYERTRTSDDNVHASEVTRQQGHQRKDSRRISKETEGGEHSSMVNSQRKHEEQSGQIGETIHNGSKKVEENAVKDQRSSKKQGDETSSDDEHGSKQGRSKLERWTSQKERDFAASSSLKKRNIKDISNNTGTSLDERPPRKQDETSKVEDKHLDTVEKLKKRSERFKLPMPREKDPSSNMKKIESDALPSPRNESHKDSDVKPERPLRKRRWTGN